MHNHDLVFWQNAPSAHQAPFMRALSAHLGLSVLVVVADEDSATGRGVDNAFANYGEAEMVVEASDTARKILLNQNRRAIAHTFSGLGAYPSVTRAMRQLSAGPHNHTAVLTEPWDDRGVAGTLRGLRFRARAMRYVTQIDSVFASGELAQRQLASLGFSDRVIVPFGYFVAREEAPRDHVAPRSETAPRRIVFVGSLEEWKDPEIILQALSRLPQTDWHLSIVGQGSLASRLREEVVRLQIVDRVSFEGQLSQTRTRQIIAESDLLILPSKYDGWGAVISEALMSGTPVVASAAAGASTLIVGDLQGQVFPAGQVEQLTLALKKALGTPTPERRAALAAWADSAISPNVMAEYFFRRVSQRDAESVPVPPWLTCSAK